MLRPILMAAITATLVTAADAQDNSLSGGPPRTSCGWSQGADPAAVIAACTQAIASAADNRAKAQAYFWRAYAHTEQNDSDAAVSDLTASIQLDPTNPSALGERAFTYGELYEFGKASVDLDAALAMAPNTEKLLNERAFDRHWLGNFAGALDDRLALLRLKPNDIPSILAVADAYMWMGAFDKAREQIDAARTIADQAHDADAQKGADQARQTLSRWTTRSGAASAKVGCEWAKGRTSYSEADIPQGIIGDCTRAFLDARANEEKADMLYWRAEMWLMAAHDPSTRVTDLIVIVGLVPDRTEARLNLGSALVSNNRSRSGIKQLDIVLANEMDNWVALGMRAAGKLHLGDDRGAFADAKRSFEIHPSEISLIVLGDVMIKRPESRADAIKMWLAAYKMGSRDDGLIQRLKDAGVTPPAD